MSDPVPVFESLRGQLGAYSLHSKYDSTELTKNGREAFLQRFEREVDPNLELDPIERARRAEQARRAHFTRLALRSVAARQERKK